MLDAGLGFFWPDGMMTHTYLERDDGAEPIAGNTDFVDAYRPSTGPSRCCPPSPRSSRTCAGRAGTPSGPPTRAFADLATRRRHFVELAECVAGALAGLTTAEAMARFEATDVPAAPVVDRDDVHRQPQVAHNGSLLEADMAPVGRVRVPVHAARFGRTPASTAHDAPLAGQHTVEVLRSLGLDDATIDTLVEARVVARPD